MTDAQLELAARLLCVRRGQDPDQQISHESDPDEYGVVFGIMLYSPRWMRVRREVVAFDQMISVYGEARRG